jgi:hypothetical protein
LDFGKHQQVVSTGKIKQPIESGRVSHSGENRLDSDKNRPMRKTIDLKHAIGFWQAPSSDGTGGWDQAAYRVGQNHPRATVN